MKSAYLIARLQTLSRYLGGQAVCVSKPTLPGSAVSSLTENKNCRKSVWILQDFSAFFLMAVSQRKCQWNTKFLIWETGSNSARSRTKLSGRELCQARPEQSRSYCPFILIQNLVWTSHSRSWSASIHLILMIFPDLDISQRSAT